jgi:hypothetical protein
VKGCRDKGYGEEGRRVRREGFQRGSLCKLEDAKRKIYTVEDGHYDEGYRGEGYRGRVQRGRIQRGRVQRGRVQSEKAQARRVQR